MTNEFLLMLGVNIAMLAAAWGGITARLKSLEKKVDKHNNLVERMYRCEGRLDNHDTQIHDLKEREE